VNGYRFEGKARDRDWRAIAAKATVLSGFHERPPNRDE
jgi:hypothetical protein